MWSEAVDDGDSHAIRVDHTHPQHPRNEPRRRYAQPQYRPSVTNEMGEGLGDLDTAPADDCDDGVLECYSDGLIEVEGEGGSEERGVDHQFAATVNEA